MLASLDGNVQPTANMHILPTNIIWRTALTQHKKTHQQLVQEDQPSTAAADRSSTAIWIAQSQISYSATKSRQLL